MTANMSATSEKLVNAAMVTEVRTAHMIASS